MPNAKIQKIRALSQNNPEVAAKYAPVSQKIMNSLEENLMIELQANYE
jgi:hypothetical protein